MKNDSAKQRAEGVRSYLEERRLAGYLEGIKEAIRVFYSLTDPNNLPIVLQSYINAATETRNEITENIAGDENINKEMENSYSPMMMMGKIAFIEERLARIEERLAIQDADVPQLFDDDAEKTYFPKFRSVEDNNLLELENSDCNTSLHNLPPKKD